MAKKYYETTMDTVFESWDYHLFEKLEAADEIAARIQAEMAIFGVPAAVRIKYMQEKIIDMIDQIAEKREENDRGKRRKPVTRPSVPAKTILQSTK